MNCLLHLRLAWKPFPRKTSGLVWSLHITGDHRDPPGTPQSARCCWALPPPANSGIEMRPGEAGLELLLSPEGQRHSRSCGRMRERMLWYLFLFSLEFLSVWFSCWGAVRHQTTCFDTKLLGLGDGGQNNIF